VEVVNGFQCKDCTDVDYAKRHVDPAHPKDGPYGVNADPNRPDSAAAKRNEPAVRFGGLLTGLNDAPRQRAADRQPALDVSV